MSKIHRAFPQASAPAEVVTTGPDAAGPRVMAAVAALQGRAAAGGPIREPVTATAVGSGAEGRAQVVDVRLAGHGSDSVSDQAVAALRSQILASSRLTSRGPRTGPTSENNVNGRCPEGKAGS